MLVALPYCPKDYEQASRLARWLQELGPYPTHKLLVLRDARCGGDLFNEAGFGELEEIVNPTVVDGWPQGANTVFGIIARHIMSDDEPQPFLLLEPDAIPLSKGWLDALVFEYKLALETGKVFMGDDVDLPPERNVPRHMSGVAIYPGNLIEHGAGRGLNSYDIAWDVVIADAVLPRMHPTKLIEHAWRHPTFPDWDSVEREVDLKNAVLFHSSKDGSLIDRLREKNEPILRTDQEANIMMWKGLREKNLSGSVVSRHASEPMAAKAEATATSQKQVASGSSAPPAQIICDILIKSFPPDYEWLSYCLRGLEKFATGFRSIIVIYPFGEEKPMRIGWAPNMRVVPVKETGNPYLFQQSVKFNAHEWTDAPYILHIDSDTVPCQPFTPATFFRGGKPLWLMTPYDKISTPWREPTEKFMGCQVEYEYMRRFPILTPRSLHVAAAKFVELHHGVNATEYITRGADFSEFNALGALAHGRDPDDFSWLDTTKEELPPLVALQHWSRGGITDELRSKFESILGGATAPPLPTLAGGDGLSCSAGVLVSSPVAPPSVQDAPNGTKVAETFTDECRRHCDALATLLKTSGGSFRSHRSMLLTELRKRRIVPPAKHKKK